MMSWHDGCQKLRCTRMKLIGNLALLSAIATYDGRWILPANKYFNYHLQDLIRIIYKLRVVGGLKDEENPDPGALCGLH